MHVDEKRRTAPDWLYWHAGYLATPDECVCLSLDTEPCPTDGVAFEATPQPAPKLPAKHDGAWAAPIVVGGMDDGRWSAQLRHDLRDQEARSTLNGLELEANKRLLMLRKHLRAQHSDLQPLQGEDGRVRIRLYNFAKWANKAGWVLPHELTLDDLRPSSATPREPERGQQRPEADKPPESVIHRTKGGRSHWLDALMPLARSGAANPDDRMSVWHSLCALAASGNPPAPLLGMAGKDIKRLNGRAHVLYTFDAYCKYWKKRHPPDAAA